MIFSRGVRRGTESHDRVTICRRIERPDMLGWALTFLIIAIIAAIFGFGGIAAGAATIAKVLFFIFLVLFVLSLVSSLLKRSKTV